MQFQPIIPADPKKCCLQNPRGPFACEIDHYLQSFRTREEMHYHVFPEFGVCLQGSGIFFVEDRIYSFSAGCVTYFPAGMLHIAQSPQEHRSEWLYLWQNPAGTGLTLPQTEIVTYDTDCRSLTELLYRCGERQSGQESAYYRSICEALTERLTLLADKPASAEETAARRKIRPAVELIAERYMEELPAPVLAEVCGVSEVVLRRLFRKATGMTPADYLNAARILMAKNLLVNTDLSVLAVALECGFPVLSTFNRQFRRTVGMSPSEYRQKTQSP